MITELQDLALIARGGQKEVYSATHNQFGRVVFKKILAGREVLERTLREVRAVTMIQSPSVPRILAHNCDENSPDYLWIVEELVEGETLRKTLLDGRKYTTSEVVNFIDTALDVAIISERLQIVHRDIKPENIIVGTNNNFWLLDFGIARHLDLDSLTDTNAPFGLFTLGYASSEQFRNLKRDIDIRTDLFSIGVVAYEMLTGINPHRFGITDPIAILKRMEHASLPPLRIEGDTQYQLSGFISLMGDPRRTRRPSNAAIAKIIFNNVKDTLILS